MSQCCSILHCWIKKNPTFYARYTSPHSPQKRLTEVCRRQKGLINQTGGWKRSSTSRRVIISDKFMSNGIHTSPTLYKYLQQVFWNLWTHFIPSSVFTANAWIWTPARRACNRSDAVCNPATHVEAARRNEFALPTDVLPLAAIPRLPTMFLLGSGGSEIVEWHPRRNR